MCSSLRQGSFFYSPTPFAGEGAVNELDTSF